MILFSLVYSATQTPEAVLARLNGFLRAHQAISAKFTCKRSRAQGVGTMTLRFSPGSPTEVDWVYEEAGQRVRFVSAHSFGIDINYTRSSYDRGRVGNPPQPSGNVFAKNGYPDVLVGRGFDPSTFAKMPGIVKPIAGGDAVIFSDKKGGETTQIELDVDPQGRLLEMHISKSPDPGLDYTFSDYGVDAAAAPSSFDTDPPIGCIPFSFDESYLPIPPGAAIPAIRLGATTLAALAKTRGLLAFVDDPLPAGLLDSLKRLNGSVPVTLITLGSTHPAGFTTYSATETDFDHAGIQATPQFYLVNAGTVMQAWLGYRSDHAATFEADVAAVLKAR